MPEENIKSSTVWKLPALCILAVIIILAMLRLGFWQLDRAEQKRKIVTQLKLRSEQSPLSIGVLEMNEVSRFQNVLLTGRYLADKTIFVDNQVINGQVGYQVFTPFAISGANEVMLVARGWVPIGPSREQLPTVETPSGQLSLTGRFNDPIAKPPLWNERYSVSEGARWQYLPMTQVSQELGLALIPLVVELAPDQTGVGALITKWPEIDDQWVAKHQGYAFQWFAMALAFSLACIVLLVRFRKN